MYSLGETHNDEVHNHAVYVRSGFGWGRVLAVGGDQVGFSANAFTVDGIARPLLSYMPTAGEIRVPEKHWFIWPELDMTGHGNVGGSAISGMMMQLATVSEDQFLGKPFNHWFGRRQISL